MEIVTILVSGLAIFIASFFATVSGFGYALIATPILATVMSVKTAIMAILITTLLLRVITMYNVRHSFHWETVWVTTVGSMLGGIPGSYLLSIISMPLLEIFLGTVLLVATVAMSRERKITIHNKNVGRLTAGFLSGFFGASTSVSGPPLALYFLNENTPKDAMRANMIWIFGLMGIWLVVANYAAGNGAYIDDWSIMLPMIPAMFLGIYLGEKFFYRLNQHLFRRLSVIIVCLGSLMMLMNGIRDVF